MKKMTWFEALLLTLLVIATFTFVFRTGYTIGINSVSNEMEDKYNIATAQRDRLADYIRIYEDMQADAFYACDSTDYFLHDFIDKIEHEDNMYADMPPMNIDDWCYAYYSR